MTKPNAAAIIFDFDGVLVDTARDIANAANFTLNSLGLPEKPTQVVMGYIGGGAEPLLRRVLAENADRLLAQALPVFMQRYKAYYCVETTLYPGVHEGLEKLSRAGLPMAIATNKLEPLTHGILEKLGISQYFVTVIGPESIQHRKPHPESILRILEQIQLPAAQVVMVGDTAADLQAGKAAGTLTCGATYGYGSIEEIQATQPDFTVNSFTQFLDLIL